MRPCQDEEKATKSGIPVKFIQNYQNALTNASRPKKKSKGAAVQQHTYETPYGHGAVKGIELPSVMNVHLAASDLSVPNLQPLQD